MAKFIKHVGINGQGNKVVVVFREVPGDPEHALVVPTGMLTALYHDDLIRAIETSSCQDMLDPSDWLFRQQFTDGTNMLNTIHQRGWMVKVPTKSIMMTPQSGVEINLVELNKQLKGIANTQAATGTRSADIAQNLPSNSPGVITDESLAAKFRQQANTFEVEVRRLREEAEKLDPKGAVAVVQENQTSLTATENKRGRGRPTKVKMVA